MFATALIGRFAVVMVAFGCLAPMPLRADPADMLLLNGRIVTLDRWRLSSSCEKRMMCSSSPIERLPE